MYIKLNLCPVLTPWSRVFEQLLVAQLVSFLAFYGTQRFVTVFTRACQWSLFWARWIRSICSHPISLRSILILSSHLYLGFWMVLPFRLSNQRTVCISHIYDACYMSHPSHPPWFDHPDNIWWSVKVIKLLIVQSFPSSCPLVWETKLHTHTKQQVKLWSCIFYYFKFLEKRWEDKKLNRMIATFPELNLLLIFSWMQFWLLLLFPNTLSYFKGFISNQYLVILSCILVVRHNHLLNFLYVYL
jgi:hypothetical protein